MEPTYTCTRCGHERGLSSVILDSIDDAAFQQAVKAAAELPAALADPVIRYMRMFGNIRHVTYAKVLGDLVAAINAGRFTHKRQEHQASAALWLAALTDTLQSTTVELPLKAANGHGYLFSIAVAKINRAARDAEQRREDELRHPGSVRTEAGAAPAPAIADPRRNELLADLRHWESMSSARPNDTSIAAALASARARLDAGHPPAEKSNGV